MRSRLRKRRLVGRPDAQVIVQTAKQPPLNLRPKMKRSLLRLLGPSPKRLGDPRRKTLTRRLQPKKLKSKLLSEDQDEEETLQNLKRSHHLHHQLKKSRPIVSLGGTTNLEAV